MIWKSGQGRRGLFILCKIKEGVKSVGTDIVADIHNCAPYSTGIHSVAPEKAEKGQGRKRKGNDAPAPGAAY